MLDRFLSLFRGRGLDALDPTQSVKVHGIRFTLRKLNPLDYLTGAKVLHQVYDLYKTGRDSREAGSSGALTTKDVEKVKEHYRDVLMAGIVSLKCNGREFTPTRKSREEAGESEIPVAHLMTDWSLAEDLYAQIVQFTYLKKKVIRF